VGSPLELKQAEIETPISVVTDPGIRVAAEDKAVGTVEG